jgi:hypothetical protein
MMENISCVLPILICCGMNDGVWCIASVSYIAHTELVHNVMSLLRFHNWNDAMCHVRLDTYIHTYIHTYIYS